jgi:hypothetical protein
MKVTGAILRLLFGMHIQKTGSFIYHISRGNCTVYVSTSSGCDMWVAVVALILRDKLRITYN